MADSNNTESIVLECTGPGTVMTALMSVEVRLTFWLWERGSQYLIGGGFCIAGWLKYPDDLGSTHLFHSWGGWDTMTLSNRSNVLWNQCWIKSKNISKNQFPQLYYPFPTDHTHEYCGKVVSVPSASSSKNHNSENFWAHLEIHADCFVLYVSPPECVRDTVFSRGKGTTWRRHF